jgi:diguanylate cyclase (GGDEF)-like protein
VNDEAVTTDRPGMPRPVVAYVALVVALAVPGLGFSLAELSSGVPDLWWRFALCVGLLITASVPWLSVRVGSQRAEFNWADAAIAVTLVLLPVAWVVPTVALAASVAFLRQRRQPIKALFNLASHIVGATLAAVVVLALATTPVTVTPRNVAVVMLAGLIFGTWTDIASATAIGLAQRRSVLSVYLSSLSTTLLGAGGNLVAAAAVLAMVSVDARLLVVVPALMICLRQAYLGRLRGREERESWQGLLDATRSLSDLDESVVFGRAVAEASRLFGADWAEIVLADGRLVRGDQQGLAYEGPAADAPAAEAVTVVDRPVGSDASPLGVLRLCFGARVSLKDREQAMLGAVAAELHSALVNAGRHATAQHEATHDPLTDLLNRPGLQAEGRTALAGTAAGQLDAAVVLIDISGFREIVDTLGHAAGDAVLVHTARRLEAALLPGELVARLEGDEFAVLLPKLTDPAQASHRADALLGAVASPAAVGGTTLSLTTVAGIAYAPGGLGDMAELLRQAGVALHAVHSTVGRIDFYAPERDMRSVSRLVLASELRAALQDLDQIELLYQPILDLNTGEAVAAEALVRWHHPARGPLALEEFLPVVEHAGLLPELTRRVLDSALGSAADWTRQGSDVPVAINVSPRTLLDRDFPGEVAAALSRHRVPAGRLTLEITETSVVSHLAVVDGVLDELRDLGVRLALDDFGTGWSSLSHLARLPVHEVKIAATFTERLLSSPQAAAVVRGTLEIARALDLRVVAEGVTGAIQRATLISLGCHAGQGDHFFPPLPADRIGPALWSSTIRAAAVSDGADVIPLNQRRPRD